MVKQAEKTANKVEFGDWQTPSDLAEDVCKFVAQRITPSSVFEPNCGLGAFLLSSHKCFPESTKICGMEINGDYVREAQSKLCNTGVEIVQGDFFDNDWVQGVNELPSPVLLVGNPPWVTNSELMRRQGGNLPKKTNLKGEKGIEAITGKSNFDISEWMLLKEIDLLQGRDGALAMLCKTGIARKVVLHAWKNKIPFSKAEIREIDARKHFNVAVDACLLFIQFSSQHDVVGTPCEVFPSLEGEEAREILGFRKGRLVSNVAIVDCYADMIGNKQVDFVWRSGIKHDCAKVMELSIQPDGTLNYGYGQDVDIEKELLFPMLKSSDLANGRIEHPRKMMIVPQQKVGADTLYIRHFYPKAWAYLQEYFEQLSKRGSSIYKGKPPFSIFGVGPYSFQPWKIAISGLYKKLKFCVLGPYCDRPVVFDDTCYFLSCKNQEEALFLKKILELQVTEDIFNALIFWDSKRPITRDILQAIDLFAIAQREGYLEEMNSYCPKIVQPTLF